MSTDLSPVDPMNPCESVREHLYLMAGGDAEAEVQAGVRAHLEACEPCAQRLREIQRLRQVYFETAHRAGGADEAELNLWPDLRGRLEAEGLLRRPAAPVARPTVETFVAEASDEPRAPVLRPRFRSPLAHPHAPRAVVGLLAGAAAGLLLFTMTSDPGLTGSSGPGESGSRTAAPIAGSGVDSGQAVADVSGRIEVVPTEHTPTPIEPRRLDSVYDADALQRELRRLEDEAWLLAGSGELRDVRPSDPEPWTPPAESLQPQIAPAVPFGTGLAGYSPVSGPLNLTVH